MKQFRKVQRRKTENNQTCRKQDFWGNGEISFKKKKKGIHNPEKITSDRKTW